MQVSCLGSEQAKMAIPTYTCNRVKIRENLAVVKELTFLWQLFGQKTSLVKVQKHPLADCNNVWTINGPS